MFVIGSEKRQMLFERQVSPDAQHGTAPFAVERAPQPAGIAATMEPLVFR